MSVMESPWNSTRAPAAKAGAAGVLVGGTSPTTKVTAMRRTAAKATAAAAMGMPRSLPELSGRAALQLRRALSGAGGAADRDVRQLASFFDAPEHQPAAAHVAAADEIDREQQPVAE